MIEHNITHRIITQLNTIQYNSAMKAAVSSDSVSTSIRITDTTINMTRRRIEKQQDQSSISSLSYEIQGNDHTRVYLERKKQIRCIWCSRVSLIEKKTTMKCKEWDRGFYRNTDCWGHHVPYGGVPMQPKRGTRKRLPNRDDDEIDNDN